MAETWGNGEEKDTDIASSKAANQESYDIIKSYLPKTVEAFEEMYEKIKRGEIPERAIKAQSIGRERA